jgi:hypothetical protein
MRTRGTIYDNEGDGRDNTFDEDDEDLSQDGEDPFHENNQDDGEATVRSERETNPTRHSTAPRTVTFGTYSAVVNAIDKLSHEASTTLEEEIGWQLGPEVTKEEIANQMELKVFMILRPGSIERAVTLVHSIAQCWASGYRGKYMAMTGDATDAGNTLTAVALQEKKTWELLKKKVSTDVDTWREEVQDDPKIKKKLWVCNKMENDLEVPRIMHVPLCLAKYMYEEGKGIRHMTCITLS